MDTNALNPDSWEPSEEKGFRFPRRRKKGEIPKVDPKEIERQLKPKLIKALQDGLGNNLPDSKRSRSGE